MDKQYTEEEVRQLRDNVFGKSTEIGWNNCKEHWMNPEMTAWLIDNQPKKSGTKSVT